MLAKLVGLLLIHILIHAQASSTGLMHRQVTLPKNRIARLGLEGDGALLLKGLVTDLLLTGAEGGDIGAVALLHLPLGGGCDRLPGPRASISSSWQYWPAWVSGTQELDSGQTPPAPRHCSTQNTSPKTDK